MPHQSLRPLLQVEKRGIRQLRWYLRRGNHQVNWKDQKEEGPHLPLASRQPQFKNFGARSRWNTNLHFLQKALGVWFLVAPLNLWPNRAIIRDQKIRPGRISLRNVATLWIGSLRYRRKRLCDSRSLKDRPQKTHLACPHAPALHSLQKNVLY